MENNQQAHSLFSDLDQIGKDSIIHKKHQKENDNYINKKIEENLKYKEGVKNRKDERYSDRFSRERIEYTEKIKKLNEKIKDINKLAELQTEVYTLRQIFVEYHHELRSNTAILNAAYRKNFKERYDYYLLKHHYNYSDKAIRERIEVDLYDILSKVKEFENQMDFFSNSLKSIDSIIFGVGHRIEIEKYKRMGSS